MSDAMKCDRCGRLEELKVDQCTVEVCVTTEVMKEGAYTTSDTDHDLCTGCSRELKRWLSEAPVSAA